ncbi:hypothetical protein PMAYCL1PPCAC_15882, partial [Pristionchus mayeri]
MLTPRDTVHTIVLCILDLSAIAANLVLIYAILTRTPASMRAYAILLLNNAFVDIFSASGGALAIARLIYLPSGPSQLYLFIGPCSYVGMGFCHLCHTIHTYFVSHSTFVLLHSFCFRLYILRDKTAAVKVPSERITLLITCLLYAPIVFVMFLFYSTSEIAPPEVLRRLNLLEYPATWHANVTDLRYVIALTFLILLPPSAIFIIFIVRRILLKEIGKMKAGAKSHHSHIAKALTYQMLLPVGQVLACTTWLLSVTGLLEGEAIERTMMTFGSFLALGSPIINLAFLPPYRRMFG